MVGPYSGVTPNTINSSITINSSGVYTISISTIVIAFGPPGVRSISLNLSINGNIDVAKELDFQSTFVNNALEITLSRTDQVMLNPGNVIQVLIFSATENVIYTKSSLVITKVA